MVVDKISKLISFGFERTFSKLCASQYAFAVWRMPHEKKCQLILSLDVPKQVVPDISQMDSGFLVNGYQDSAPTKPYFIKADIVIAEDGHISIDPRVSSEKIEQFLEDLINVPDVNHQRSNPQKKPPVKKLEQEARSFQQSVQQAIEVIDTTPLEKVVLSRTQQQPVPESFDLVSYFQQLCGTYVNAFCSVTHLGTGSIWVGATPEILISDNANRFLTVSLAGTKGLDESQQLSEIAWTQKEIEEQAFVSRYIINCFKKLRLREFHENGPKTVKAGNLAHLKTTFEVRYHEMPFDNLASQMLELLHPTSAVCGMPVKEAKQLIDKLESYKREFYAGFLGPVQMNESTDLFVNLRCMKVEGQHLHFYAGAGITEDSVPAKELKETEMKMETLKRLF